MDLRNTAQATILSARGERAKERKSSQGWVFRLYDLLISTIGLLLIFLYLGKKLYSGKPRRCIGQRLGFYPVELLRRVRGRDVIWIHAVSVGETRAAIPLIEALRKARPDAFLLLSNVTETGHATARKIPELDATIFFPFDLSMVVHRALKQISPSRIIIIETEIWPNFIRLAHAADIPVFLANGRISDRSYPRYRRVRFLLEPVLQCFSGFCMQTDEDAARIERLGAPQDRVEVTRNLKFDMPVRVPLRQEIEKTRSFLGLPEDSLLWVAGSTHAGEEETVAEVHRQLRKDFPNLFLLLVPRHPERSLAVAESLAGQGFTPMLRSRVESLNRRLMPGEVLVGDTLGELVDFYACGDLAFVGGSLVGVGGHNLLEPASVNKPVLFGPHVQNFREISRMLLDCGAALSVKDGDDLLRTMRRLLADADLRRRMGEAGRELLDRHAGAAERAHSAIAGMLKRQETGKREAAAQRHRSSRGSFGSASPKSITTPAAKKLRN